MSRVLRPNPFIFALHILPRKSNGFLFIAFSGMYTDLAFSPFILVLLRSHRTLYLTRIYNNFGVLIVEDASPCYQGKAQALRFWEASQDNGNFLRSELCPHQS